MMYRNKHKKGISTIIAAIFMVAIIMVGLNVMTWGLNLQNNFGQVLTEKNVSEAERVKEKIELRDVKIDSNKFNMTVVNTGTLPVKLVNMWVTNTTDTNGWHKNYTLNKLINPGDSLTGLGTGLSSLVAKNSSSYKINLVTERGSAANFQILSPTDKAIKMNLFPLPRSVPTRQNVTLLFGVTNNLTDGSIVQSITPKLKWPPAYTEAAQGTIEAKATIMEGPTPISARSLFLAESVFFKWIIKVEGDPGDRITFNATIANAKVGNYVIEPVDMVVDTFAEQSITSLESLGIAGAPPDTTGTLHFHLEAAPNLAPNYYRLESVFPDTSAGLSYVFDTSGEVVYWITNNGTDIVNIDAGNWNFTIYGNKKTGVPNLPAGIRLEVQFTDKFGSPVGPVLFSRDIITSSTTETAWGPPTIPNANLPAQQIDSTQSRLRVKVSWLDSTQGAGGYFEMKHDKTAWDSVLRTPEQTPSIPTYLVYSGGDVPVFVRNTGSNAIWLDKSTRIVFEKISTGALYAGIIKSWKNETSGATGNVDSTKDSDGIEYNGVLRLFFSEPRTIPMEAATGTSVTTDPGTYNVMIRLSGYDEQAGVVLRIITVGAVVV